MYVQLGILFPLFHYKMDAFKGNIYLGITIEIIFKLEQAFIFLFQVAKLNFKA